MVQLLLLLFLLLLSFTICFLQINLFVRNYRSWLIITLCLGRVIAPVIGWVCTMHRSLISRTLRAHDQQLTRCFRRSMSLTGTTASNLYDGREPTSSAPLDGFTRIFFAIACGGCCCADVSDGRPTQATVMCSRVKPKFHYADCLELPRPWKFRGSRRNGIWVYLVLCALRNAEPL